MRQLFVLKRFPHDPESDEHLEARETSLPEAGVSSSLLFAPFGQAVHLQPIQEYSLEENMISSICSEVKHHLCLNQFILRNCKPEA